MGKWLVVVALMVNAPLVRAEEGAETDPEDPSLAIAAAVEDCRVGAARARELAADCRRERAADPNYDCWTEAQTPTGNLKLTPDETDALAERWEKHAKNLEPHVSMVRDAWAKVRRDQKAIRNLGFEKRAAEFLEWEKMATDEQAELHKKTHLWGLDRALDTATGGADVAVAKFTNSKTEKIVKLLKRAGLDDKELFKKIRKLGSLKSRKAIAAEVKDIATLIGRQKAAIEARIAVDKSAWAEAACPAFGLLLEALSSKHAMAWNFLCSEGDFITEVAYAAALKYVATDRVEQLTEMTEEQLRALKKLHELMKQHVAEVKRLVEPLRPCEF